MKIVLTYGTFDLLHYGHILLLNRAKELGDYLIVGLSSDRFNNEKGKKSCFSFDQRKVLLESLRCVDEVLVEDSWEQKGFDILSKKVDIFVMGDDWLGKFDHLNEICEVRYLSRTNGISTTIIKEKLKIDK